MTKEERKLVERAKKIPNALVRVPTRPKCDFCSELSIVDGKTRIGCWANMCLIHFRSFGVGLGLGKGQVLLTDDEGN